jgi:hypothetical protein
MTALAQNTNFFSLRQSRQSVNYFDLGLPYAYVVAAGAIKTSLSGASATYVCDGIADSAEVQTAVTAYPLVFLSDGNFNFTTKVTKTTQSIIVSIGGKPSQINYGSLDTAFEIGGVKTSLTSSLTFPSAGVTAGTTQIIWDSDVSAILFAGDEIEFKNGQLYNDRRSQYTQAEKNTIVSVVGNVVNVAVPWLCTYSSASGFEFWRYTLADNTGIDGITFVNGTATANTMVTVQYATNAFYRNCICIGNDIPKKGLQFLECFGGQAEYCTSIGVKDSTTVSNPSGHGAEAAGCEYIEFYRCNFYNCKDGVDNSGNNATQPIAKYITYRDCYAYRCDDEAFDMHGKAYRTVVEGCTGEQCGKFFSARGEDWEINNCIFIGTFRASDPNSDWFSTCISIGETVSTGTGVSFVGGIAGKKGRVNNFTIRKYRSGGGAFTGNSAGLPANTYINAEEAIYDLEINNCVWTGASGYGFYMEGNENENMTLSNMSIQFNTQFAGRKTGYFDPQADPQAVVDILFENSTIITPDDVTAPYIESATGGSITETNITVI